MIDHRIDRGRPTDYNIRYAYLVGGAEHPVWQDCQAETYVRYGLGALIPIVYDARNPERSRTHIGVNSNARVFTVGLYEWVMAMMLTFAVLCLPWAVYAYLASQRSR